MIFWNIETIMLGLARTNFKKYIISIIRRRHMKSMPMEIGRLIEIIYQIEFNSISRIDMKSWPWKRTIIKLSSEWLTVNRPRLITRYESSFQNAIFTPYIYGLCKIHSRERSRLRLVF